MNTVERMSSLMKAAGAEWVLWLLIGLSIFSIAVIVERVLVLRSLRTDIAHLRRELVGALRDGGFKKARALLAHYRHPAARIALSGVALDEADTGPEQARHAMGAETVAQRRALERRFSFLATLGANAPFIGLFGTVVGILQAFDALGSGAAGGANALAPQLVMTSISEALVATAVGLGVAIPAVCAFNTLEKTVKSALDDAEILSLEILSHLAAKTPVPVTSPVHVSVSQPRIVQARTSGLAVGV